MYKDVENGSSSCVETAYTAEQEKLLDSESSDNLHRPSLAFPQKSRITSLLLLIGSYALVGYLGAFIGTGFLNKDTLCSRHASQYSPILKDVNIAYNVQQFNGSLLKENVFRKSAGPEVDAAWESLGVDYRSVVIPDDQAAASGLLPDQVKIQRKYGGGYIANVEGLHQLHCLNVVRQALYYNIDYYRDRGHGAFANSETIQRYHISHCLDIVRQQLMCQVDTGVLGQVWFHPQGEEYPEAYVDFNTEHKCKNFDAVRQWAKEHQMSEELPDDLLEPPKLGDKIYYEIP